MATQPVNLMFPLAGLHRRSGFQSQPPFTTPDCLNVWPDRGGRIRGGSRPGLEKVFQKNFATSVFTVGAIIIPPTTVTWKEDFGVGTTLDAHWSVVEGTAPVITGGRCRTSAGNAVTVVQTEFTDLSHINSYVGTELRAYVIPVNGGIFWLFGHGDATVGSRDGLWVRISFSASYSTTRQFSVTAFDYQSGTSTQIWTSGTMVDTTTGGTDLHIIFNSNPLNHTVLWRGVVVGSGTVGTGWGSNARLGFRMDNTSGTGPLEISGYSVTFVRSTPISRTFAVSHYSATSGTFWRQALPLGTWQAKQSLFNPNAVHVYTEWFGQIFFPTQVYKASTDTLTAWTASRGTVPPDISAMTTWRDRIVVSARHVWHMSRVADPWDWDYGASDLDPGRAIAGTLDEPGSPITAIIASREDVLLMTTAYSTHAFIGDPAAGGSLITLSRDVGAINHKCWCRTDDGDVYLFTWNGLYVLRGGTAPPVPVGNDTILRELIPTPASNNTAGACIGYDQYHQCIHVFRFISGGQMGPGYTLHLPTGSFWPIQLGQNLSDSIRAAPVCVHSDLNTDGSRMIFGCSDGFIRRFSQAQTTDDGTAIASHVTYGPIRLGTPVHDGCLDRMDMLMAEGAAEDNVTWSIRTGGSGQNALDSSVNAASGTFVEGRNFTVRPRVRGASAVIKLSSSQRWAVEDLAVWITRRGHIRRG